MAGCCADADALISSALRSNPTAFFINSNYTLALTQSLHRDAVRTGRPRFESCVEVKVESSIFSQLIVLNLQNVDFVVAFIMNNSQVIFIEEIVGDHQAAIIVTQHQ